MMHALIHSIVGQFRPESPASLFAQVFESIAYSNTRAGTLSVESFSDEIRDAFRPRVVEKMPAYLTSTIPPTSTFEWNASEFGEALTVANLVGSWQEGSEADMAVIGRLSTDPPSEWLRKMRAVLQLPDCPLMHINGVWKVKNRMALWTDLAPRLFNQALSDFRECAVGVLSELNPEFDLDPDDRFAAQVYGKTMAHSYTLRSGMATTLAFLGVDIIRLPNCSTTAGKDTAHRVVRVVFENSTWRLWGSLDLLLPTLAEAAPEAFLNAVEFAFKQNPCPFDELLAQEKSLYGGANYVSGLLRALETLAWDESYLVRVVLSLAALSARDPGENLSNRAASSLKTIFLPWRPQTLASFQKREVAVRTIMREYPDVGWQLLLSLLPSHHGTSIGTRKPKWRNKVSSDDLPSTTVPEYWNQIAVYSQIAVEAVRKDVSRLENLFNSLEKTS